MGGKFPLEAKWVQLLPCQQFHLRCRSAFLLFGTVHVTRLNKLIIRIITCRWSARLLWCCDSCFLITVRIHFSHEAYMSVISAFYLLQLYNWVCHIVYQAIKEVLPTPHTHTPTVPFLTWNIFFPQKHLKTEMIWAHVMFSPLPPPGSPVAK